MPDNLTALDGVGEQTENDLLDAGLDTFEQLAVLSAGDLDARANIGEGTAQKIIQGSREKADVGDFETAVDLREKRKEVYKITTLADDVDEMLGGGIETGSMTEFYGEFGTGKSQFAHQMAVNVQLPVEAGGTGGSAVFIDTEDTFRPERIEEMVRGLPDEKIDPLLTARGITRERQRAVADGGEDTGDYPAMDELVESVLSHIHVAKAYNSNHQMLLGEKAEEICSEQKENVKSGVENAAEVGAIIVDSLTSHFRSEYVGRGELAERQQKLNKHIHDLVSVGDLHNAAVIVANQVQSNPDSYFGDPTKPIGGNVLGHASNFRIYLRQSKADKRVVRLVDAPNLPNGEAVIRIKGAGIRPE